MGTRRRSSSRRPAPFEELKLRVLNGSHTACAYLGLLAGHPDVGSAMEDPAIRTFVQDLLASEIVPALPPVNADVDVYASTVLNRFANPRLAYSLDKLGADGTLKLVQRLAATALTLRADDRVPTTSLESGQAGFVGSFDAPSNTLTGLPIPWLPGCSNWPVVRHSRCHCRPRRHAARPHGTRPTQHRPSVSRLGRRTSNARKTMTSPVRVVSIGECMIELRARDTDTVVGLAGTPRTSPSTLRTTRHPAMWTSAI